MTSAVASGGIAANSATISWTTNEARDSQVEFGTTTTYGTLTTLDASLVTSHSVSVTGLAGSTLYHYRVLSRDASGNLATGADVTFTTLAGGGATGGSAGSGATGAGSGGTTGTTYPSHHPFCGFGGGVALLLTVGLMVARRRT